MAAEGRRRAWAIPLLALCLALMVALHYYAIFFLVPLAVAEVVRSRTGGKVDFAIWAAMVPAPLILGLHYVLLVSGQDYGTNFWAQPSFGAIVSFYERFLLPPLMLGGLALLIAALVPRSSVDPRERMQVVAFPLHEWVAIAALVLLPPVVIVVSMYTTHAFFERYLLWAAIGFALLGAAALAALARNRVIAAVSLIAIAIVSIARLEIGPVFGPALLPSAEVVHQELEALAQDGDEPIVVGNAHAFMELSYYLKPPLRERLVFPLSRDLDLRYRGFDTDAMTLGPLAERAPIRVVPYAEILAGNKRFLLVSTPADYLAQHLMSEGYRVTPLQSATTLYEVQSPDVSPG